MWFNLAGISQRLGLLVDANWPLPWRRRQRSNPERDVRIDELRTTATSSSNPSSVRLRTATAIASCAGASVVSHAGDGMENPGLSCCFH